MRRTRLFKLLKPLPKGAALHLHFDSLRPSSKFITNVSYLPSCYVCLSDSSVPTAFRFAKRADLATPACSSGWQSVAKLRSASSNVTAFDESLYRPLTMVPRPGGRWATLDEAWGHFQAIFGVQAGLLNYRPAYEVYVSDVLDSFVRDGVQHIEVRGNLQGNLTYELDGTTLPATFALELWIRGTATRGLGFRFIYSAMRGEQNPQLFEDLQTARALAADYPETVVGFDLVGQEDHGRPLVDVAPMLLAPPPPGAPKLHYVFHAGETKRLAPPADEIAEPPATEAADCNLYDALLLNSTRIGHGFALREHRALRARVAQRRIGIEVCLLSNQILGLVDDLRDHPYFGFVNDNLPVVLSSDDPGLWETEGVSYDWTTAFMIGGNSCANGMRLLKQLAINSIEQSLVGEAERTTMLGAWRSQWTDYVDWLLKQSAD